MRFYRGLIVLNIMFALIVIFEIVGYAWIIKKTVCVHIVIDGLVAIASLFDVAWSARLWPK
ncbi:MAG: hypothetical protein J6D36_04050 [Erysipelotrichaceae bacterium]|nr:hypothetical protein [Erysipelotrichaceae bacterium]